MPKEEGSISSIFTTLSPGEESIALPDRFTELKRDIFKDELVESWRQVLSELEGTVSEIKEKGNSLITKLSYDEVKSGKVSQAQIDHLKRVGTVIVTGAVPKDEALAWKQQVRDYAAANSSHIKGFPEGNIQVYEMYNSIAQTQARIHEGLINTQKFLLSLWHTSKPNDIKLDVPVSYYDRLRIRQPGDTAFTLGPHIDGGSVERWEDPGFRSVFGNILKGGNHWKQHDPFNATPRITVQNDIYHTSNACSIFRPWQGWTSLSFTGPNEGTLQVLPNLRVASAYIILRPFFRPKNPNSDSLKFENWELDLDRSNFPGSRIGKTQELNTKSHPHLKLDQTMVSIPKIEPGDQVYWHCDVVHAVEGQHRGLSDSSVLYIPAIPLTLNNAHYLRDQRDNFISGLPAPDFPGGEGESKCMGRGSIEDVKSVQGRLMLGFEKFGDSSEASKEDREFFDKVNRILEL
ncbi:hypothetical protein AGABI1DRAFT_56665 [Agaricus bisporus var. burnettii JB137-S8]|uniref:DUF1479 domain protein n=1 Tax=Agaricus bisporus var. burnettii (strain JB137-S8 / ATCC MYA-4627 / FGSC 10392) TaxID=597362 RepID=K5XD29_AGABU|nr:uncharacterized protein AGABI1DRAFT_56665 [Agaricus bisporus var. burnettii JB137-S8]EKM81233.1 hypothetical protein AGABI1DRAFT_56665 [Agaricus bisporus var. burnettii JB137-S8]